MAQKRNKPLKGFTLDPDALLFLEKYASERDLKSSPALSELLLHLAGEDKSNPKLVKEALKKTLQKK